MFDLPSVLITGAQGQLGYELVAHLQEDGFDVAGVAADELDICDEAAVIDALRRHGSSYVVNAAAVFPADSNPDDESDEACRRVNREGAAVLARVCAQLGRVLVHISCAEVFEGTKAEEPCLEMDKPASLTTYSLSKWEGEEAIRTHLERHIIIRTGWLFSARREGFVRWLLNQSRIARELRIREDLQGEPTSAGDLGRVVAAVIKQLGCGTEAWGTYHYAGAEVVSRYGFAEAIIAVARQYDDLPLESLLPVVEGVGDEPRQPCNARLNCQKILSTFGIHQRPWRPELLKVVQGLYSSSD